MEETFKKTDTETNKMYLDRIRKYFFYHVNSLYKILKEKKKFNKFREKLDNYLNRNMQKLIELSDKYDKNKCLIKSFDVIPKMSSRLKINENFFNKSKNSSTSIKINFPESTYKYKENTEQLKQCDHSSKKSEKTFICMGGYSEIKKALISRGWQELKDLESFEFDLKWVLYTSEVPQASLLRRGQIVNHYLNNTEITKKSGLAKNLRNMILKNINIYNFFPRSYEVTERNDFEDFLIDFKFTKALSLLKQFNSEKRTDFTDEMLITAINICERRTYWLDSMIEKPSTNKSTKDIIYQNISEKEWQIISEESNKNRLEAEILKKMNNTGNRKTEGIIKKLTTNKGNYQYSF